MFLCNTLGFLHSSLGTPTGLLRNSFVYFRLNSTVSNMHKVPPIKMHKHSNWWSWHQRSVNGACCFTGWGGNVRSPRLRLAMRLGPEEGSKGGGSSQQSEPGLLRIGKEKQWINQLPWWSLSHFNMLRWTELLIWDWDSRRSVQMVNGAGQLCMHASWTVFKKGSCPMNLWA